MRRVFGGSERKWETRFLGLPQRVSRAQSLRLKVFAVIENLGRVLILRLGTHDVELRVRNLAASMSSATPTETKFYLQEAQPEPHTLNL